MVRSLSLPSRGRAACYYCGPCERGMHYAIVFPQRKRDPARGKEDRADLVTALQRGAQPDFDSRPRKATGVRVIDARTRAALEFPGAR
jgi:hypothetical protein